MHGVTVGVSNSKPVLFSIMNIFEVSFLAALIFGFLSDRRHMKRKIVSMAKKIDELDDMVDALLLKDPAAQKSVVRKLYRAAHV